MWTNAAVVVHAHPTHCQKIKDLIIHKSFQKLARMVFLKLHLGVARLQGCTANSLSIWCVSLWHIM